MARTKKRATDPRIVVKKIPEGLSRYANWVCWRAAEDGDPDHRVWLNPRTGGLASTWNVGTWSPLDEALDALERDPTLGGLGYALFEEARTTAIHVDGCVYSDEERIPMVEATMQIFDTYCEMNPEGDGVTMLVKSRKPGRRSHGFDPDTRCRIRIHDRNYFVPITGKRMDYLSHDIEDREQLLEDMYAETFSQVRTYAVQAGAPEKKFIAPEVILDEAEDRIVGEVVRAMAFEPLLYQQDGYLVHVLVVPDPIRPRAIVRRATPDSLRAVIARHVSLLRRDASLDDYVPAVPPKWLLRCLLSVGRWDGVRYLSEISEVSMYEADGVTARKPRYDPATAVLNWPSEDGARDAAPSPRLATVAG